MFNLFFSSFNKDFMCITLSCNKFWNEVDLNMVLMFRFKSLIIWNIFGEFVKFGRTESWPFSLLKIFQSAVANRKESNSEKEKNKPPIHALCWHDVGGFSSGWYPQVLWEFLSLFLLWRPWDNFLDIELWLPNS